MLETNISDRLEAIEQMLKILADSHSLQLRTKAVSNMSKLDRIKQASLNTILTSTSHGIPNIARTEWLGFKIMWTIVVILAGLACGYFMFKSVADYMQFDYFTKTQLIDERPMPLPTITFCVNTDAVFDFEKAFILCKTNVLYCGSNHFELVTIFSDAGAAYQCLRLNGGKNMSGHAVDLLKAYKDDDVSGFILAFYMPANTSDTLYYALTDSTVYATMKEVYKRSVIKPVLADLIINKQVEKKLGQPYNKCIKDLDTNTSFDSALFRSTFDLYGSYRQKNCYVICIHTFIIKTCNCSLGSEQTPCDYMVNNCSNKVFDSFSYEAECAQQCPLECDTTYFSLFEKFSPTFLTEFEGFDKNISANFDLSNLTAEQIENIVWFRVKYENLKYTEISQTAKTTFADLVSNLGGIIGVFLGLSFLSLIEVVELFLEVLRILSDFRSNKLQQK